MNGEGKEKKKKRLGWTGFKEKIKKRLGAARRDNDTDRDTVRGNLSKGHKHSYYG